MNEYDYGRDYVLNIIFLSILLLIKSNHIISFQIKSLHLSFTLSYVKLISWKIAVVELLQG